MKRFGCPCCGGFDYMTTDVVEDMDGTQYCTYACNDCGTEWNDDD